MVTACTLPPWLPPVIIDSMILHFVNQLRQEFIDFKNHYKLLLDWTTSLQETPAARLVLGVRKTILMSVLDLHPSSEKH